MSDVDFGFDTGLNWSRRQCQVCAAIVGDPKAHAAWHERLRDALINGVPVIDPDDIDQ
jgi:hypothetical protein